jgi:hypothetical protein
MLVKVGRSRMRGRFSAAFVLITALALASPRAGSAAASPDQDLVAGIKDGLKTALLHSNELAQGGGTAVAIKLQLQHTINCLEGPAGLHFRPAVGDPCQGKGHGIIPDLQSAAAKGIPGAEKALGDATVAWSLAIKALAMTDVNEAQPWGLVAAKYLKMAAADLGG